MLLTNLLLKHFVKITFTCLTLLACNFLEKTGKLLGSEPQWQDYSCDTTLKVKELNVMQVAQSFYLKDTLLRQNLSPQKVFVVIADPQGNIKMGGVTAQDQERPEALIFPNIQLPNEAISLSWQEQEYLWALASQPRYLYNRWEKLLSEERMSFLSKRDSIHQVMKELNGSVKIISDLRSMAIQQKYLGTNKTASPISMHNFGFAADFAVIRNNRISNNLSLYNPLDNLTAHYGMTWGGNFIGFIDPGHIQLFKNGAEMLRKYPDLIFEFEPYRPQYNTWMTKMINWGKEEKANDTKELLVELNKFKKEKPCPCLNLTAPIPYDLLGKIDNQLNKLGYQQDTDILLVGDLASQTVILHTKNGIISYPLGRWK
jgi:peptidoglycan L-alanyl-D-glutamate endopeptidase CwlK